MIVYAKHLGAFNLLLRLYGSTWPRAALLALPSTLMAVLLYVCWPAIRMPEEDTNTKLPDSFLQIFSPIVIFFLTFRTSLSYGRYRDGMNFIKTMTVKWTDTAMQIISATESSDPSRATAEAARLRLEVLHLLSLMHALALQRLRGDTDVANLTFASLTEIPEAPTPDPGHEKAWLAVRRKRLRGLFFLRSDSSHYRDYWRTFPLPVLGGLSEAERTVLCEADDAMYLVLSWIMRVVQRYVESTGKFPQVMGKFFEKLGNGTAGYENAYNLARTPFPFPFAQSTAILTHIHAIVTPFVFAHVVSPEAMVAVSTFLVTFGIFLLNEVSQDIEDPFKFDPNDLPLPLYQHDFNMHLVTGFVKGQLPGDGDYLEHMGGGSAATRLMALYRPSFAKLKGVSHIAPMQGHQLEVKKWP